MDSNKQVRQVIVRLLNNLGSQREVRQYLRRFSSAGSDKFAVVKIGGSLLEKSLGALSSSLAFLQQVGLTPVVVHGGGPQLNAALQAEGLDTQICDGLRVTTPEVLKVARRVFQRANLRLVDALQESATRAASITSGVFEAQLLNEARYGMVGQVSAVHLDSVTAAVKAQVIPVISPLAETADGQILNINADMAANELVRAVRPFKIIFLTETGGILDEQGELISSINLSTDYEALERSEWLHSGMRLKLEQVHDLLRELPRSSSVSITRPALLAKELFTYRGSGTLVRWGEKVNVYGDWDGLDRARLKELLESSFKKMLCGDYFARTPLASAYVSDSYRAAAVVTPGEDAVRLDKFAVTEEAQGEGLGRALWNRVREDHSAMIWRARPGNPVNQFYFEQADGCVKGSEWNVFWYGLSDLARMGPLVERTVQAEPTLR